MLGLAVDLVKLVERVDLIAEALLHAPLIGGASVLQTKRHGFVTVQTIQSDELSRELVELFHHDLVIA